MDDPGQSPQITAFLEQSHRKRAEGRVRAASRGFNLHIDSIRNYVCLLLCITDRFCIAHMDLCVCVGWAIWIWLPWKILKCSCNLFDTFDFMCTGLVLCIWVCFCVCCFTYIQNDRRNSPKSGERESRSYLIWLQQGWGVEQHVCWWEPVKFQHQTPILWGLSGWGWIS